MSKKMETDEEIREEAVRSVAKQERRFVRAAATVGCGIVTAIFVIIIIRSL